jgi:hypothetical protein
METGKRYVVLFSYWLRLRKANIWSLQLAGRNDQQGNTPDESKCSSRDTAGVADEDIHKLRKLLQARTDKLKVVDKQCKQYQKELKVKGQELNEQIVRKQNEDDMKAVLAEKNKSKALLKSKNKGNKECKNPVSNSDDESDETRLARFNITKTSSATKVREKVLLVAPDTSQSVYTECDATSSDDAQTVEVINNHRHYEGEEPEFLVTFDNGERIWSTRKNLYIDNKELLAQYLKERDLWDSEFEPKQMKQQRMKKLAVNMADEDTGNGNITENASTLSSDNTTDEKNEQTTTSVKNSQKKQKQYCLGDHDWYTFNDELNAKYCSTGYQYCGVKCAKCKREFLDSHKKVTESPDEYCYPTTTKPMKTCPNRLSHECNYAVCFACFQTFVSEDTKPVSRCRRNQRHE